VDACHIDRSGRLSRLQVKGEIFVATGFNP
jgi:hypothetical protein